MSNPVFILLIEQALSLLFSNSVHLDHCERSNVRRWQAPEKLTQMTSSNYKSWRKFFLWQWNSWNDKWIFTGEGQWLGLPKERAITYEYLPLRTVIYLNLLSFSQLNYLNWNPLCTQKKRRSWEHVVLQMKYQYLFFSQYCKNMQTYLKVWQLLMTAIMYWT